MDRLPSTPLTKVAIIHSYWDALGGAERLALQTIVSLNSKGVVPDLYTMRNINKNDLLETFGNTCSFNLRTLPIFDFRLSKFILYQILLHTIVSSFFLSNYDLVINTGGSPVFTPLNGKVKGQVIYVHSPVPNMFRMRTAPIYYWPFMAYMARSVKKLRTSPNAKFLCNSNFTRERLRMNWNVNATTIYPPVDLERFRDTQRGARQGVVTIGRFVREKNHLDQLAIAARLPHVMFRICGTAKKQISLKLLNRIRERAHDLANVTLLVNTPFAQLRSIIWNSKVFLHTMKGEDFGIATVEAIMGGCIPLVADSGGCKETVPYKQLRFNTLEEAQELVNQALNSDFDDLLPGLMKYAEKHFSEERFRTQILEQIIEH